MEALEQSIQTYELQLKQVNDAILASASDPSQNQDLVSLKTDLEQLVSLTKQNLVELKKEALLKELEQYDDKEEYADEQSFQKREQINVEQETDQQDVSNSLNVSALEGVKCQAPFKSVNSAKEFYHNAVIFATNTDEDRIGHLSYENLHVRVVFSNPTCQKMIPCKYYLDGKCNFSEDRCRHSHGELVKLKSLKEYLEPNYAGLREGAGILANEESSNLWKHATVEGVEHDGIHGTTVHIRFSHDSKNIVSLPLEHVVPLNNSLDEGDDSSDEDEESSIRTADCNPINETPIVRDLLDKIDGSVSAIGGWESHTKGIGSKLMASMGYIHGTGLGKQSEGRREPVPILIYPPGCSIDYCMGIKEKLGNKAEITSSNSIFSAEKVLERARKKEELKNLRKLEREKSRASREKSFFDLINSKLVRNEDNNEKCSSSVNRSKETFSLHKQSSKSSSSKRPTDVKSDGKALKVEEMRTFEEIKRKEKHIEKLEDSLRRNKNSGDRDILNQKLKKEKHILSSLKARENSINKEQSRQVSRKKLEIF